MDAASYTDRLEKLFVRHPSVQQAGFGDAYKPGLAHMREFAQALGDPHLKWRSIHVAGTNGKGSVANMLASALSATGLKVGLYTSPHIIDFRERMRIIDDGKTRMVSREWVWDFLERWEDEADRLDLSFFEVTTGMAMRWFADEEVDLVVMEVGLGGRLDSTNIITPELTVVTSIGLDHCALLGDTRSLIAREKAGIFKGGVSAVVGSWDSETAPVFEECAEYAGCPLSFADRQKTSPREGDILARMDLQGAYQAENLHTALVCLEQLGIPLTDDVEEAVAHTAARMDFHGRWEMLHRCPDVICDIGHNPPALEHNFAQLRDLLARGRYARITIVYGVMADKALDDIMPLMPLEATWIFVAPSTPRALDADTLYARCSAGLLERGIPAEQLLLGGSVSDGLRLALDEATPDTLVYVGGSTFVVTEVISQQL